MASSGSAADLQARARRWLLAQKLANLTTALFEAGLTSKQSIAETCERKSAVELAETLGTSLAQAEKLILAAAKLNKATFIVAPQTNTLNDATPPSDVSEGQKTAGAFFNSEGGSGTNMTGQNNDYDYDDDDDDDDDDDESDMNDDYGSLQETQGEGINPAVRRFLLTNRFGAYIPKLVDLYGITTMGSLAECCEAEDAAQQFESSLGMAKLQARALVDVVTNERNPKSPRNVARRELEQAASDVKRQRPLSTIEAVRRRRELAMAKERILNEARQRRNESFVAANAAAAARRVAQKQVEAKAKDTSALRAAKARYYRPTDQNKESPPAPVGNGGAVEDGEEEKSATARKDTKGNNARAAKRDDTPASPSSPIAAIGEENARRAAEKLGREEKIWQMSLANEARKKAAQEAAAAAAEAAAQEEAIAAAAAAAKAEAEKQRTLERLGLDAASRAKRMKKREDAAKEVAEAREAAAAARAQASASTLLQAAQRRRVATARVVLLKRERSAVCRLQSTIRRALARTVVAERRAEVAALAAMAEAARAAVEAAKAEVERREAEAAAAAAAAEAAAHQAKLDEERRIVEAAEAEARAEEEKKRAAEAEEARKAAEAVERKRLRKEAERREKEAKEAQEAQEAAAEKAEKEAKRKASEDRAKKTRREAEQRRREKERAQREAAEAAEALEAAAALAAAAVSDEDEDQEEQEEQDEEEEEEEEEEAEEEEEEREEEEREEEEEEGEAQSEMKEGDKEGGHENSTENDDQREAKDAEPEVDVRVDDVILAVLKSGLAVRKVGGNGKAQKRIIFLDALRSNDAGQYYLSYHPAKTSILGILKKKRVPPQFPLSSLDSVTLLGGKHTEETTKSTVDNDALSASASAALAKVVDLTRTLRLCFHLQQNSTLSSSQPPPPLPPPSSSSSCTPRHPMSPVRTFLVLEASNIEYARGIKTCLMALRSSTKAE